MGRPSKTPEVLNETNARGLTPFDQLQCRIEFRQARYEGIFTPPVVGQQSLIFPGHHGGLNWGGVMVDLQRGLLIINNQRLPYMQGLVPREQLDAINAKSFQSRRAQLWVPRPCRSAVRGNQGPMDVSAGTAVHRTTPGVHLRYRPAHT